jgi:histone H3/H4
MGSDKAERAEKEEKPKSVDMEEDGEDESGSVTGSEADSDASSVTGHQSGGKVRRRRRKGDKNFLGMYVRRCLKSRCDERIHKSLVQRLDEEVRSRITFLGNAASRIASVRAGDSKKSGTVIGAADVHCAWAILDD